LGVEVGSLPVSGNPFLRSWLTILPKRRKEA
jgi:hypothetical protein